MRRSPDGTLASRGDLSDADRVQTHRSEDAAADADCFSLLVIGANGVTSHPLPRSGRITLGRQTDSDVHIADPSVSRVHARIELGPTPRIEDLGSANGVRVRQQRIPPGRPVPFAPGDAVELGSIMVVLCPRAIELEGLAGRPTLPPPGPPLSAAASPFVVEDPAMVRLHALIERLARSTINVLVLGETGVGKDVVAERLHRASLRAAGPFLQLNCAAFTPSLLESELFGYDKGAFTGAERDKPGLLESTHGGTLLLDEVGELPLATQAKLLRVVEERKVLRIGSVKPRPVDVRFVAATNRDLRAEIAAGSFRQDLYFRLNGVTVVVPPLRERVTEIASLARAFIDRAVAAEPRARRPTLSDAALAVMQRYAWPGNVRELRNAIERAVVLCASGSIEPADLPPEILAAVTPQVSSAASAAAPRAPDARSPASERDRAALLQSEIDAIERQRVLDALEHCGGNQTRAAALLGISRSTLIERVKAYALPRPRKSREPR